MPVLEIKFDSDWRIGSGTGRLGDVDHLVRRDADQCPFLPAKTLTGILRDSCERVAQAMDEGNSDGPWQQWLVFLFGSQPNTQTTPPSEQPRPAHLKLSSAHFDEQLRNVLRHRPHLLKTITFVKPGIKISAASGAIEDQCFRLEEMARGGSIRLKTTYNISGLDAATPDQWQAAHALLVAGAALVERIGGKRRRGAGRCSITLPDLKDDNATSMGLKEAHTYLHQHLVPPAPPLLPASASFTPRLAISEGTEEHNPSDAAWSCFILHLVAQQPIIIAKETLGNVVESRDHIPGGHLLPIVARHLGRLRIPGLDIGGAIAQSQLILTHAIPTHQGKPTAPIPFALFSEKQVGKPKAGHAILTINKLLGEPKQRTELKQAFGETYREDLTSPDLQGCIQRFQEQLDHQVEQAPKIQQLKQLRGGYLAVELDSSGVAIAQFIDIHLGIETHNTVNDNSQRPSSDVGGVYSYQAIPAGTELRAELRLHPDLAKQLPSDWASGLKGNHHMGVSSKDEYGQVTLDVRAAEQQIVPPQSEVKSEVNANIPLTLWLLSDLLLRDQRLRPTSHPDDLCAALAKALGLELGQIRLVEANASNLADQPPLLARQARGESWQTRWGLPRPSLAGLGAGSCFRFQIMGELPAPEHMQQCVQQLLIEGLGDRRVEGYGQVSLNSPLLQQNVVILYRPKTAKSSDSSPRLSNSVHNRQLHDYARQIETVAWRDAIQRAAMTLAGQESEREKLGFQLDSEGNSQPSLSQLGGLRSQLIHMRRRGSASATQEWLESLKKAKKESFPQVVELLKDPHLIWQTLNLVKTLDLKNMNDLCCTVDAEEALQNELRLEAIEIYVSECIRAQSRASEQRRKQKKAVAMSRR